MHPLYGGRGFFWERLLEKVVEECGENCSKHETSLANNLKHEILIELNPMMQKIATGTRNKERESEMVAEKVIP